VLRLDDSWVWDSWVADDGELYHLFFLQAPRSLGDPALRHAHARVGHATSRDLVAWDYQGECLQPVEGGFDDLAIWTGSVVRARDRWWLFYTGVSASGSAFGQRVGCAVSDDLTTWRRAGRLPVLQADPRWYETLGRTGPADRGGLLPPSETWRDPLVVPDPGGDGWHALLTARAVGAGRNDGGVVGHATTADLTTWRVQPPRSQPGAGFGQLEVVQSKVVDGQPLLVFTCHPQEVTAKRLASSGRYCTWSVPGESVLGPWDVGRARPFTADPHLFAAPLVQQRDDSWAVIGFRNLEERGEDGFSIHDPIPVTVDGEGYLVAR
jgi:beta-fructofuranosidase